MASYRDIVDPGDEPVFPRCPLCSAEMGRVSCWHCHGEGGFHDCGEDCCCCLHPDLDLNRPCEECRGRGAYWECPNVPHEAKE